MKHSKAQMPIPLRVTCVRPIISEEGDLVVAGTPGTVLRWDFDADGKRTEDVMVAWDHYVFLDDNEDQISTHKGLEAETQYDNLSWSSS